MGVHGKPGFEVWGTEGGWGDVKGAKRRKGEKWEVGKVGRWEDESVVLDLSNKSVLKVSIYIYITKS